MTQETKPTTEEWADEVVVKWLHSTGPLGDAIRREIRAAREQEREAIDAALEPVRYLLSGLGEISEKCRWIIGEHNIEAALRAMAALRARGEAMRTLEEQSKLQAEQVAPQFKTVPREKLETLVQGWRTEAARRRHCDPGNCAVFTWCADELAALLEGKAE